MEEGSGGSPRSEEGATLSKARQKVKTELHVSISFESNRLSEQFLSTAYELAFPVIQQETGKEAYERDVRWQTSRF